MIKFALQLLLVIGSTALLQWVDVIQLGTWAALGFLLLIATPLAVSQVEYSLFAHRAAVDQALPLERDSGSWFRAWLWAANLKKLMGFLGALLGASLLLLLCYDLHPYYWIVLYVESVVVVVITRWIQWRMADPASPVHAAMLARQFAYWFVAILLAVTFVYLGYAHVEVPDLRGLDLTEVFQRANTQITDRAQSPLMGLFLGLATAISDSTWYLMQVITSGIEQWETRVITWLLFLLPAAVHALLMIRLHLGMLSIVEWKARRDISVLGKTTSAKIFSIAFIGLIALMTWLAMGVTRVDVARFGASVSETIGDYDPCRSWSPKDSAFTEGELADIAAISQRVTQTIAVSVDRNTQAVYREMGVHIDDYLDWYYSSGTQFRLQILYLIDILTGGGEGGQVGRRVANFINLHIHEHLISPFRIKMAKANGRIAEETNQLLDAEFRQYVESREDHMQYLSSLQTGLCVMPALLSTEHRIAQIKSRYPAAKTAGGAAAFVSGAVATKAASKKIASAVAAKTVAKMAGKLGLSLGGKAVSSGAAIATGLSASAICGPAAPACALFGGLSAAIIFEMALNEADELLTRAETRHNLRMTVLEMTKESKAAYTEAYAEIIEDAVKRTFNPDFKPIDQL